MTHSCNYVIDITSKQWAENRFNAEINFKCNPCKNKSDAAPAAPADHVDGGQAVGVDPVDVGQANEGIVSGGSQNDGGQAAATAPTDEDQANAAAGKESRARGRPKRPLVWPLVDSEPAGGQRKSTRVRRLPKRFQQVPSPNAGGSCGSGRQRATAKSPAKYFVSNSLLINNLKLLHCLIVVNLVVVVEDVPVHQLGQLQSPMSLLLS